MRWHVDPISPGNRSGWIYDPNRPDVFFDVLALSGRNLLARARADEIRPAEGASGLGRGHGFTLALPEGAESEKVILVCLAVHPDLPAVVIHSPDRSEIGCALASYQSFGEGGDAQEGASLSAQKLEALCLPPLEGKSLLDLGCNEGFFCLQARLAGARRVLGVDADALSVEKARARAAAFPLPLAEGSLEFRRASWWDLPDERFDVILFLSAIHYEPDPKKLLDMLLARLAPGGVLILECGVVRNAQDGWLRVQRSIDVRRFPSERYLLDTLLAGYAVRAVADSPTQAGDPVPRAVFHCTPRKPVVGVIRGGSGSGKSVLSRLFEKKGVPVFRADVFLHAYATRHKDRVPDTSLYRMIREELNGFNLNRAAEKIKALGAVREFCRDFAACLPLDEELCLVEGALFTDPILFAALVQALEKRGTVVWDITRTEGADVFQERGDAGPNRQGT